MEGCCENKWLQATNKVWSSSFGVGWEAKTTPHHKKAASYEILHRAINLEQKYLRPLQRQTNLRRVTSLVLTW
jgi:hypothetical protein